MYRVEGEKGRSRSSGDGGGYEEDEVDEAGRAGGDGSGRRSGRTGTESGTENSRAGTGRGAHVTGIMHRHKSDLGKSPDVTRRESPTVAHGNK